MPKLVRAGHRVAICEQIESPLIQKKVGKSSVTEFVTPAPVKAKAPKTSVPVTEAVETVKKAVAPICQQLTFDFGL